MRGLKIRRHGEISQNYAKKIFFFCLSILYKLKGNKNMEQYVKEGGEEAIAEQKIIVCLRI